MSDKEDKKGNAIFFGIIALGWIIAIHFFIGDKLALGLGYTAASVAAIAIVWFTARVIKKTTHHDVFEDGKDNAKSIILQIACCLGLYLFWGLIFCLLVINDTFATILGYISIIVIYWVVYIMSTR